MLLVIAVLVAVGALMFTLLIRAQDVPEPEAPSPTAHLEQRKAQIYENLRDLQFEFRVGKLSDDDYQKTKLGLQTELARVLAEIDGLQPAAATAPVSAPPAEPEPVQPETAKLCPHCGAKFARPMKFCGECGKAMVV
ncbi:MAG TPA: hypothetical protein VMJ34_20935 [Bryobacteraceae bacterium]|nr:hypothetical protein [Bryobacteraceae bacterium]